MARLTPSPEPPLREVLAETVARARLVSEGAPASYIPQLAAVDLEQTSACITLLDGTCSSAGDAEAHRFTLQSTAKVVLLASLLEEVGHDEVFALVGTEPSGSSFASIARLETHGPYPANPLVNAGAIALCSLIPGQDEGERQEWLQGWMVRLCAAPLAVDEAVRASEALTGRRNRAIAYFLEGVDVLRRGADEVLATYFTLCSFAAGVEALSHLGAVLASGGLAPGEASRRLLSPATTAAVVSLMATCGMYDESGSHLLRTGLPAKSGVSGAIIAVAPGRAGISVASPRVNSKGGSVRGHQMLEEISRRLGWHFALPNG